MPTAVMTGCNSGQGFAFAESLIEEGYEVIATVVNIGDTIKSLGCQYCQLDVTKPNSIETFVTKLGKERPLDVLLNIAGIMIQPEQDSLEKCNMNIMTKSLEVNTFGPFLLSQALLLNLLKASKPHLVVMSSRVGSIAHNGSGGYVAYLASKTAVNSLFKTLVVKLKEKGVMVSILHPGLGLD